MKKSGNQNHPKKKSKISLEPIKKIKDINLIKKILKDTPRNCALFVLGINTNLRASDILGIKVCQVYDLKSGDELTLNEKKTGKSRRITLNKTVINAIQSLLQDLKDHNIFSLNAPLFMGQRNNALTVPSLSRLVKQWCNDANLKGNYASHTLRKTWGYHQRVTFGVGIPELMVCFNHSTQKQTLDYLCIQPSEIKKIYLNEL